MSQLFASGDQSTGVSALSSVLSMNTQDSSPLGWTGWIYMHSKVVMYGCESWTVKKAECRRIDAFELWCCIILLPVHSKGNESWVFIERTDAKAETPILWPPHVKSWLIGKDPDAGRDWGQEEKGMTEDEMAGWHHQLDGCESEWTLGVGDGQGGLVCCDSWRRKELDMTEQLNWTENK